MQRTSHGGDTRREPRPRRRFLRAALVLFVLVAVLSFLLRAGSRPGESTAPAAHVPEPDEAMGEEPSAQPRATAAEPLRVLGRCIRTDSRAGVPGAVVVLVAGGPDERVVRSVTDSSGRFETAWPAGRGAQVQVLAGEGRHRASEVLELTAEELAREPEILVAVEPVPLASVSGLVRDLRSGQGLHAVSVELSVSDGSVLERIPTTSEGAFAFTEELPPGGLSLRVLDEAPEGLRVLGGFDVAHQAPDAVPLELEIPVGPGYRLLPSSDPSPRGELRARLVEHLGDRELAGVIVHTPAGFGLLPPATQAQELPWSWRALRPELNDEHGPPGALWFRYPRIEREPDPAHSLLLEVEAVDGSLAGQVQVSSSVGFAPAPLPLAVHAVGTLSGRVEGGDPSAESGIELWLEGSAGPLRGPWFPDAGGAFELRGLEVGPRRLLIRENRFTVLSLDVEVVPGRKELPSLRLPRVDSRHTVRGLFECDRAHGAAALLLEVERDPSDPFTSRTVLVRVERESRRSSRGAFAISDLPAGRYSLRPISLDGVHRFSPDEVELVTPATDVVFQCVERGSAKHLELDARDAETDLPVEEPSLEVSGIRLEPTTWPESRPAEHWYRLPRGAGPRWTVWAPGYQPLAGTGISPPGRTGGPHRLRVQLERGFGAVLVLLRDSVGASAESDLPPIAGVRIVADGTELGTTDERGELVLALPSTPRRIELRHGGWLATSTTTLDAAVPVRIVVLLEPR